MDVYDAVRRAQFPRGTGVMAVDQPGEACHEHMMIVDLGDGRWRIYVAAHAPGEDDAFIEPITFLRSMEPDVLVAWIETAAAVVFARMNAARAYLN